MSRGTTAHLTRHQIDPARSRALVHHGALSHLGRYRGLGRPAERHPPETAGETMDTGAEEARTEAPAGVPQEAEAVTGAGNGIAAAAEAMLAASVAGGAQARVREAPRWGVFLISLPT